MENTIGEHPPNDQGKLLCNGHCKWGKCSRPKSICILCGYIACDWCIQDFDFHITAKRGLKYNDSKSYCINCLAVDTYRHFPDPYLNKRRRN